MDERVDDYTWGCTDIATCGGSFCIWDAEACMMECGVPQCPMNESYPLSPSCDSLGVTDTETTTDSPLTDCSKLVPCDNLLTCPGGGLCYNSARCGDYGCFDSREAVCQFECGAEGCSYLGDSDPQVPVCNR